MEEARGRKNQNLLDAGRVAGYETSLITLEVGSRSMLAFSDIDTLRAAMPRGFFKPLTVTEYLSCLGSGYTVRVKGLSLSSLSLT